MKAPSPPGLTQTGRSGAFILSGCFSLAIFINILCSCVLMCLLLLQSCSQMVSLHMSFTITHDHPRLEILTPTRQACVPGMLFSCVLMCLHFCCSHALLMCLHMSCSTKTIEKAPWKSESTNLHPSESDRCRWCFRFFCCVFLSGGAFAFSVAYF